MSDGPAAPLVSVAMITYNHVAYIRQALESVRAQWVDFPIEVVISDDRSPDGTATEIDRFQADHPELPIRRLDPPANIGMHANLDRVWRACRGKYIALLEGDDFWTSADKLATQVTFMEANPECTVCGHAVTVVGADGAAVAEYPERPADIPTLSDHSPLFKMNYLQTCSVVCRRGVVNGIPSWFHPLKLADWPLFILHAVRGSVGFLPRNLASYRVHSGGVWSSLPAPARHALTQQMWEVLAPHLPRAARGGVDAYLVDVFHDRYFRLMGDGRTWAARRAFWDYLRYRRRLGQLPSWILPWMAARLFLPALGSPSGRIRPGEGGPW